MGFSRIKEPVPRALATVGVQKHGFGAIKHLIQGQVTGGKGICEIIGVIH